MADLAKRSVRENGRYVCTLQVAWTGISLWQVAVITQQAFERGDWAAVSAEHQLESHDREEWLRYGATLLHTIDSGPEQSMRQQQAALAFAQAQKEGASSGRVAAAQRQTVVLTLQEALPVAGMSPAAAVVHQLWEAQQGWTECAAGSPMSCCRAIGVALQ